jgi:hypothetical protein
MLQIFADDPGAPGATPIFNWPMNTNEPLAIDMLAGNDVVLIQLPSGQTGPIGGMQINFGTGTNHLQVASGRVRIDSVATGGVLSTTVASDAQLFTNRLNQNGLTVVGDGRVSLLPGSILPSVITSLELVGGATLDLNESALIVDYSGASPLATIRENIISGRGGAGLGNGTWSGNGITSSAVAALNIVAPESKSIGYAENAMLPLGSYTSFHGQPVDNTAILLTPTRTADANLDGLVNDDEVTIVGAFYRPGAPNPHWQWGDFDYNGSIDDDDVTVLGALYTLTTVNQAPPAIDLAQAVKGSSAESFELASGQVTDANGREGLMTLRPIAGARGEATIRLRYGSTEANEPLVNLLAQATVTERTWQITSLRDAQTTTGSNRRAVDFFWEEF